ncbi:MAG: nucleotidyltransferase domain-containing protein [Nanoarchaeota archaeon]|nr:nucleotidyltransferase domain-containing protein [Nanoarchaeota archaeon]
MTSKQNTEEIPEMNIGKDYSSKSEIPKTNKLQKETEKTRKELEKLKKFIIKKYPFTEAIGILPPKSVKKLIEDELGNLPESDMKNLEKKIHLYIIVPEEKFKEIPKIKAEIVKEIDSKKQNVWVHIKTPVDIWGICLDSKFDLMGAISMSYPLYDKGILGALRVTEIHKSLVLRKFEKYVVSYVLGGSLVRGEAIKTSDVDVFIIINDTDVRRMSRLELKERLRGIIHQYIAEATALAGVKKNILNVQVYLLTDFWESVKDAHPVMFTFIRDGIPIYDRGTFMPWKALLKMGKLKPSPEAIDLFMSMGDKTIKRAKTALLDILVHDLYWGVITPSQALLMLYGLPPPTPRQTVKEMEKTFVNKEKMLEKKYLNILDRIVGLFKDYEHEKLKEIKGAEIDGLMKDTEAYLKRLKELRVQIEKRSQEKTIEEIYKDVFNLLERILGKRTQNKMVEEFEKKLIKTGKLSGQSLRILNDVIDARLKFKKGKLNSHKVNEARKNATILISDLIEYSQREDLASAEKSRIRLKYRENGNEKFSDLIIGNKVAFLITGKNIQKITDKIESSNVQELSQEVESQKSKNSLNLNPRVFRLIREKIGDFEILF